MDALKLVTCCKVVTRRVRTLPVANGVASRPMGGPYLTDYKLELQPVVRILRIAIARWKGTPYSYRVLVFREYFGL